MPIPTSTVAEKEAFDRYGLDFRYTSKLIPGLMVQGEWWQGHDGANATTVGLPANGTCQDTALCGGSGAPGVQRRTWYVLGKYLISDGLFQNWEPTVMYEQFDPRTIRLGTTSIREPSSASRTISKTFPRRSNPRSRSTTSSGTTRAMDRVFPMMRHSMPSRRTHSW